MRLVNTIKFPHMTLGLVPKVFNSINMVLLIGKEFRVINSLMLKL